MHGSWFAKMLDAAVHLPRNDHCPGNPWSLFSRSQKDQEGPLPYLGLNTHPLDNAGCQNLNDRGEQGPPPSLGWNDRPPGNVWCQKVGPHQNQSTLLRQCQNHAPTDRMGSLADGRPALHGACLGRGGSRVRGDLWALEHKIHRQCCHRRESHPQ